MNIAVVSVLRDYEHLLENPDHDASLSPRPGIKKFPLAIPLTRTSSEETIVGSVAEGGGGVSPLRRHPSTP